MRNPAVAGIYGNGKSRSKPLHAMHHEHGGKQPSRKMMIRHRGYMKMMSFIEMGIKKTGKVVKVYD